MHFHSYHSSIQPILYYRPPLPLTYLSSILDLSQDLFNLLNGFSSTHSSFITFYNRLFLLFMLLISVTILTISSMRINHYKLN